MNSKSKSKLVIQLADGSLMTPLGETAHRETIDVGGIKVKLRIPIVDAKGTYDLLLGRDWLKAVQAVGNYRHNTYTIESSSNSQETSTVIRNYYERWAETVNDIAK